MELSSHSSTEVADESLSCVEGSQDGDDADRLPTGEEALKLFRQRRVAAYLSLDLLDDDGEELGFEDIEDETEARRR